MVISCEVEGVDIRHCATSMEEEPESKKKNPGNLFGPSRSAHNNSQAGLASPERDTGQAANL